MLKHKTEDEVRDLAKEILGFKRSTKNVVMGTGQLTTFNQLDKKIGNPNIWKGVADKPDGWYLPKDRTQPALVLEVKNSSEKLTKKHKDEVKKNMKIIMKGYKDVIGILYNSKEIIAYKNEGNSISEIKVADELQDKDYYLKVFKENKIDKNKIYKLTKTINELLHNQFGIKNLYHRMIFTACALVAQKVSTVIILQKGMDFDYMHTSILNAISKSLEEDKKKNQKIHILAEVYSEIKMNSKGSQRAIDTFIDCVDEISQSINSEYWNGEDVMGIFFNEFNRYKAKSDSGQVFTPEHITSLMYRLIDVNKDSVVFDGACGSGGFLAKSMSNMIKESGGNSKKIKHIKQKQLYGIEFDREIYALACANMLIHKDGKSNFEQLDTRTPEACEWIYDISFKVTQKVVGGDDEEEEATIEKEVTLKKNHITKVLMNPPFETKYGCLDIVNNVLSNVPEGIQAAFILPDHKLEKGKPSLTKEILKNNTITNIIKLPEETFREGVSTSIFIFETGKPHYQKPIKTFWIKYDGLETVKNQGRQDTKQRWQQIEDEWVGIIKEGENNSLYLNEMIEVYPDLDKMVGLSYPKPKEYFEVTMSDFNKTAMEYEFYKEKKDIIAFQNMLTENVMYSSDISESQDKIVIKLDKE